MFGAAGVCFVLAFFGAMSVGRLSYINDPDAYTLLLWSLAALALGAVLLIAGIGVKEREINQREAEADAYLTALLERLDAEDWEDEADAKLMATRH